MTNPYTILDLPQNADEAQIARSQIRALRKKKYTLKEIAGAQTALRKPATRLAADFTFPIMDSVEVGQIQLSTKADDIDLSSLNPDKYDSL